MFWTFKVQDVDKNPNRASCFLIINQSPLLKGMLDPFKGKLSGLQHTNQTSQEEAQDSEV